MTIGRTVVGQSAIGIGALAIGGLLLAAAPAEAQMIGIGPRFSVVRGNLATSTPTTRFVGGTLRLNTSKNLALEGAMDMRTTWNTDHNERLRETPLQGSVILYPLRTTLAPYVLGGMGIYGRTYDVIGSDGVVTSSTSERKIGTHLGFGGELHVSRHAVAFLDYRYRFVKFGNSADSGTTSGSSAGSGSSGLLGNVPGLDRLKVSHEGSMWTGGVAFVF